MQYTRRYSQHTRPRLHNNIMHVGAYVKPLSEVEQATSRPQRTYTLQTVVQQTFVPCMPTVGRLAYTIVLLDRLICHCSWNGTSRLEQTTCRLNSTFITAICRETFRGNKSQKAIRIDHQQRRREFINNRGAKSCNFPTNCEFPTKSRQTAANFQVKVKGPNIALKKRTPHRATERHLPYGITQCYQPPDTGERAPP